MIVRAMQILHPELVLDRRGDRIQRAYIRKMMGLMEYRSAQEGGKRMLLPINPQAMRIVSRDMNMYRFISVTKRFEERRPKVYAMGKGIMQALLEVDTEIPAETLPDQWFGYISFPPQTVRDATEFYQGAYVWCDLSENMNLNPDTEKLAKRAITVVAVTESLDHYCSLCADLDSGTIKNIGIDVPLDHTPGLENRFGDVELKSIRNVFIAAISSALFINSQDPDLRDVKPLPKTMSLTQAKKTGKDFIESSTLPMTLVDWSWVPSTNTEGKALWYRRSHWSTRWTGAGRTIAKAVLVKGCWNERKTE